MKKNNSLLCDPEANTCEIVQDVGAEKIEAPSNKHNQVTVYYFSDPICSYCWAFEPFLRKWLAEYGEYFVLEVKMGGLLKSWQGFTDNNNGISQPKDVASHWNEVGIKSRMPIDGSIWLDDPLDSSFPPSQAYKIVQKHDPTKAALFLRKLREFVFIEKQNISKAKVIIKAMQEANIAKEVILKVNSDEGKELLQEDIKLARQYQVRGFPTLLFTGDLEQHIQITGIKSYDVYVEALQKASIRQNVDKKPVTSVLPHLKKEKALFAKELEVLMDMDPNELQQLMTELQLQHPLRETKVLNEIVYRYEA